MNKRKIGKLYEDIAVKFLKEKGYKILTQNFTYKGGEIDIIATCNERLVAIEVKSRNSFNFGESIEAVNKYKLCKICKGISVFLDRYNIHYEEINIEIITFDSGKINHIIVTEI